MSEEHDRKIYGAKVNIEFNKLVNRLKEKNSDDLGFSYVQKYEEKNDEGNKFHSYESVTLSVNQKIKSKIWKDLVEKLENLLAEDSNEDNYVEIIDFDYSLQMVEDQPILD